MCGRSCKSAIDFGKSEVFPVEKLPISLIIDDPAPRVFVFYEHSPNRFTKDGRPLKDEVPNSFLDEFCAVMEKWGLRGKFSVIPMPGGRGDIVSGIPGFDKHEIDAWLDTVRSRVMKYFSICPEILTHAQAVDLETGALLDINERDWAQDKTRTELTPYIAKALALLKEAGVPATGVTSPWDFGIEVEDEYIAAISEAFHQVYGMDNSWYFLHCLGGKQGVRPWIALDQDGRHVVSIPAATGDHFWQTMDTTDTSDAYVSAVADELITEDGSAGEIIDIVNGGGWPVLLTHWQSLFSNGLGTGLRALDEVARRIDKNLGSRVQWVSSEEIMQLVLKNPEDFPKPNLEA